MLGLNLDQWNLVMVVSLAAAALAAVLVLVSTTVIVKLQKIEARIASEDFERYRMKSDVEIASANSKTAEAVLRLEQLRREVGPRQLDRAKFLEALAGDVRGKVEVLYMRDDAEAMELAQQIALALQASGWEVVRRDPIPDIRGDLPAAMAVGGQPKGVTVAVHSISEAELMATQAQMMGKQWTKTPYTVLSYALQIGLGGVGGHAGGPHAPPVGLLRIVVAPRI